MMVLFVTVVPTAFRSFTTINKLYMTNLSALVLVVFVIAAAVLVIFIKFHYWSESSIRLT